MYMYIYIYIVIVNFTIHRWQFPIRYPISPQSWTNPNGRYLDQTHYIPVVAIQRAEDRKIDCHSHYSRKILLFYLLGCCSTAIVLSTDLPSGTLTQPSSEFSAMAPPSKAIQKIQKSTDDQIATGSGSHLTHLTRSRNSSAWRQRCPAPKDES